MNHAPANEYPIPKTIKAWVLGNPEELTLVEKPMPEPGPAEVLVRVDAIAVCATDIEILKHGVPALVDGELPFNRGFTPGHEYMGTVVRLGPAVDEFEIGDRVAVDANAAVKACIPRASITATARRATAPTASAPMAASPNTPSTTSTRWFT